MQINRDNQQRARAARTDHLLKAPEVKLPVKRNREEISLENEDEDDDQNGGDFDKETAVDSEDSAKEKKAANLAAAVTDALFAEQTAKIDADAAANQNQDTNPSDGNTSPSGGNGETASSALSAEEKDKIEME